MLSRYVVAALSITLLSGLVFSAIPAWAQAASPPSYDALVEPDDRLEVYAQPLLDKLAADPANDSTRWELVQLYRQFGDWEKGLEQADILSRTRPDDADLLEVRASLISQQIDNTSFFGKGELAEGLAAMCEEASRRAPTNKAAWYCLAQFHLQAPSMVGGDKAKADAAIAAMAPLDSANHLILSAERSFAADDTQTGLKLLGEAVPLLNRTGPLVNIGLRRLNNGDKAGALAVFDRAAEIDPTAPGLLYQLGRTSALTGERLELGRDALLRFLSGPAWMNGTNFRPAAHWRLGMIFEAMGDKAQAEKAYRRTLQLDPKHKEAKAALKKLK